MIITQEIQVTGMHCNGCETIIEERIKQGNGIISAKADCGKAAVKVSYDANKTNLAQVYELCAAGGYPVKSSPDPVKQQFITTARPVLALLGLVILLLLARKSGHFVSLPEINSQISNGMVFIVGLLTGLHCVGMCGGFLIGCSVAEAGQGYSLFSPHIAYCAGKTISYTMLGAVFGFIGSLFRITPFVGGLSISIAAVVLILYGLNMLGMFSALRSLRLKMPAVMMQYAVGKKQKLHSPFLLGLFSGFLFGCGPLQVMYVLAAGIGNALEGAKLLFLFGLGTVPALLSFGLIARVLSNAMTRRFIQISGILLIVMGLMMLNKGFVQAWSGDEPHLNKPACCSSK